MLAVMGVGHVTRCPLDGVETVALVVAQQLPGVGNGIVAPSSGRCWFHGEVELPAGDVTMRT